MLMLKLTGIHQNAFWFLPRTCLKRGIPTSLCLAIVSKIQCLCWYPVLCSFFWFPLKYGRSKTPRYLLPIIPGRAWTIHVWLVTKHHFLNIKQVSMTDFVVSSELHCCFSPLWQTCIFGHWKSAFFNSCRNLLFVAHHSYSKERTFYDDIKPNKFIDFLDSPYIPYSGTSAKYLYGIWPHLDHFAGLVALLLRWIWIYN